MEAKRKAGRQPGQQAPLPDIVGQRFGDLLVIAYRGVIVLNGKRAHAWRCRCVTVRNGKTCNQVCVVLTAKLNGLIGRRCPDCNKRALQQRANERKGWLYR
jgi:uncharacterized protein with PIN domain